MPVTVCCLGVLPVRGFLGGENVLWVCLVMTPPVSGRGPDSVCWHGAAGETELMPEQTGLYYLRDVLVGEEAELREKADLDWEEIEL